MIARIRQLLAPPVFENDEKTQAARLLNVVLLTFAAATLILTPVLLFRSLVTPPGGPLTQDELFTVISMVLVLVLSCGLLVLVRRGRVRLAGLIFLSLMWVIIVYWVWTVNGLKGGLALLIFPMIIVLAGLLIGGRATIVFSILTVAAMIVPVYLEATGRLKVTYGPASLEDVIFGGTPLLLTGVLLRYAVNSLNAALVRARENEQAQVKANRELQDIRASLEERVAERTEDLERRSAQLEAAVEVSRVVTSILDADRLIWEVVNLIRDRFGLYHVSLFQIDSAGLWAVYRAGAGAGGRELVDQSFRLEVGGASLVGWCTANAKVRVAQDVKRETVRVDHALVPDARSEAALPLLARGHVIGAISVQSDRLAAFDAHTLAALETIAEQVAVALDNARLFAESQDALEAARRAYGERSREAWAELSRARAGWGFVYSQQQLATSDTAWRPEMADAVRTRRTSRASSESATAAGERLAVPILVRDQVVGVLGFEKAGADGPWTAEEGALLEGLAGQLGAALESAQLFEETQVRAARDRLIGEATARLRQTLDVEVVLQSAIREIGDALSLNEVEVRLLGDVPGGPPAGPAGNPPGNGRHPEVQA